MDIRISKRSCQDNLNHKVGSIPKSSNKLLKKNVYQSEHTLDYEHVNSNLLKMASQILSIITLFAIATIMIPLAQAVSPTEIELTSVGNTQVDLAWDKSERMISTWTSVSNYDKNDKSFTMKIVQEETGDVVAETPISVITNSQSSSIDFNLFIKYRVNAEDICQNEKYDASTPSLQECNPLTGAYEMQISADDGSVVESTTFTIVDTRE